jgi:hypothetical protein
LNFEFLLFLDHGDVIWDYPKGRGLGEKEALLDTILGRGRGVISTFVIENHIFCFDTP